MKKLVSNPLVLISVLYIIVCFILFKMNGVKNVNDSYRYLEYADNLKNGFYFDKHNFWYFGYAFFIFIVKQIYNSDLSIVIGQYVLSWIAVISIYKTSKLLFDCHKTAILTALSYILILEILSWNSYILCESVYCSLICISFFLLTKIYKRSANLLILSLAVFIIPLTVLTKPTGIALLCAVLLIVLSKIKIINSNDFLRYVLLFISSAAFLLLTNKMLTTYLVLENYQLGEIIYGSSTLKSKPAYDLLYMSIPNDLFIPQGSFPLLNIFSFIIHNPIYWTKLFISKVAYLIVHVRPYWSIQHNVFSLLTLIPLYFYAIRGVIKKKHIKAVVLFFATYLLVHIMSIGITSVDWDGRFLMPILPAIFIFSANEIVIDVERLIHRIRLIVN